MPDGQEAPRPFVLLSLLLAMLAVTFAFRVIGHYPIRPTFYLLLMIVAAVASENSAPKIGGHSASISLPLVVALIALQGPGAAAVLMAIAAVRSDSFSSLRMSTIALYNSGQTALVYGLGGLVYVQSGGRLLDAVQGGLYSEADFPALLLPMVLTVMWCAVANVILTSVGMSLLYRISLRKSLSPVAPYILSLVAFGFVGFLIAQVVVTSTYALPLFLFPLVLSRQIYQRYATLNEAYIGTVRSLIGALEAKDPYTRGHSERVAECAVNIGRSLGYNQKSLELLERAALLHDIGKIVVSAGILCKPANLNEAERTMMLRHPEVGSEMVRAIPPLHDLGELILHHHERFDGSGYPAGIRGESIPQLARVLAVADSYDAMTTSRAYRKAMLPEDALHEIARCSGSQFDPDVARQFLALAGYGADNMRRKPRLTVAVPTQTASEA